ncbi:MAG: hypothetical protein A2487_11810 [Candidatus Raymondbacteria bacterium RifOxyC12_full_50_8]|uniref:Lipid A biosynthesis acyltransferase n=1 Tax=Candidatus Raymondbacteria bacterium RIFOXYD12_FULL_49_13 TaxID=1817890 RepID=A0A1F7F6S8_UNCRA|nr:MAG: hypothetical protein A2248_13120 [Candidatus Raymondbacteria bacterium RIFOXYA2_FULL_49_16]OGJ95722.1 MAG: hypothetical protein A2487_11810 [Candidatus Raymondbacteria bacterium RifOxyC12_full_50_8]OGJ96039.1 MAG: hypothetical protein A2350_04560 [Candidatus Raymondbacteria bacterium RifOxyB12_full_50_8]OGK02227.1 MAG: hypothetical protein A2519_16235 [Candidatus Raymondbacteria bacterium RIFOXYD12_FULL_49_13]OGP45160.1 MAG: hypothetical protein A2324_12235 [Candidatus Raymondbacteria b
MKSDQPLKKRVKNTAIYLAIRAAAACIGVIPRGASLCAATWLARAAYQLAAHERNKMDANLARAFGPELTEKDRRAIGERVFANITANLVDAILMKQLFTQAPGRYMAVRNLEIAHTALAAGRGIIFVTAHTGCFEMMPPRFSLLGFPILVLGAPSFDERVSRFIARNRGLFNVTYLERQESPRAVLSWLKQGRALGVLCDLDTRVESRFVPFFGQPAKTVMGPFKLGVRTGALLIPVFTERMADNTQRVTIHPPLEPRGHAEDEKITSVMTQFNTLLEQVIRNDPAQWIWMHDRWKSKP